MGKRCHIIDDLLYLQLQLMGKHKLMTMLYLSSASDTDMFRHAPPQAETQVVSCPTGSDNSDILFLVSSAQNQCKASNEVFDSPGWDNGP